MYPSHVLLLVIEFLNQVEEVNVHESLNRVPVLLLSWIKVDIAYLRQVVLIYVLDVEIICTESEYVTLIVSLYIVWVCKDLLYFMLS